MALERGLEDDGRSELRPVALGEQLLYNIPVNIRQPEVSALISVGQAGVV